MRKHSFTAIVVGTGAAGFNAACRLREFGIDVAIITEGIKFGTSRNTGSDKQTYYKLGLSGNSPDSVVKMAENLFAGGAVDGDNALCEAALSVRSFMNLAELGVPFPHNRYGEYVGYKTDHDPFERATSAGPLTSKFMTEVLEANAKRLGVEIFDKLWAIEILKDGDKACGLLTVDKTNGEFVAFKSANIVLCTGGPAGIYADSVYPQTQTGSTGLALMAGAATQNLTEWQYGLASVSPRWNVSGTYMQVLPRFVSVDDNGTEFEFLSEYFDDVYDALSTVFLKGYQWPFDSKKVLSGSSVIDLLVYRETVLRGRRVYLDYTKNPFDLDEIDFARLSDEARIYLTKAEATFGTPIERLRKMNEPAIELYRSRGVDISEKYLEIALSAQHNNGGIAVDLWWQTTVRGLFACGECAGTHGIARPGGSALNAGQVGSLRAAQYISKHPLEVSDRFDDVLNVALKINLKIAETVCSGEYNIDTLIKGAQRNMSDGASAIRNTDKVDAVYNVASSTLEKLMDFARVGCAEKLYKFYMLRDILTTQCAVTFAMKDYRSVTANSRGSALYYSKNGNLRSGLDEIFRLECTSDNMSDVIQEIRLDDNGNFCANWRSVRPLPENDDFFENVWSTYRENGNIY